VTPTLILDGSIAPETCERVIQIYGNNTAQSHTFGNPQFYPLNLDNILDGQDEVRGIIHSNLVTVNKIFDGLVLEWAEIVKRPIGSWHAWHRDLASPETKAASITFLNDNFRGGELKLFDGTEIPPVVGRTVFFAGVEHEHSVNPFFHNDRYVIAAWYK